VEEQFYLVWPLVIFLAVRLGTPDRARQRLAIFVLDATTRFPGTAALIPVAGATLAILAGSGGNAKPSMLIANRPAQIMGNVSYSWYLWHWPLMVFPVVLGGLPELPERLLWMVASLVLAFATYYLVENRVRFSPLVARTPLRGFALGGVLTLSVLLGCITLRGASASALSVRPQETGPHPERSYSTAIPMRRTGSQPWNGSPWSPDGA
jgi:peptidoglycan/LPS O-acetylase OafA/YrhL